MTGSRTAGALPIAERPHAAEGVAETPAVDSPYAWYVLVVLMGVYTLSWMDRTILSILAEDLKARFALTDAELGFLHGTAFGVFYALFGYPLGRLADRWKRIRLLSICIGIWSVMTMACGVVANVGQLITARIGVGIGEAAVNPSAYSLLSDWFSRGRRGTALGIYSAGFYLGQGLAFAIGGLVLFHWAASFGDDGPFGLQGWQVAFFIVGLPGLAVAALVSSLREPRRGLSDGTQPAEERNIWPRFLDDVASVLPPFTFYQAARSGKAMLVANVAAAMLTALCAGWLIGATGDRLQWIALGIGCYAAFSSAQMLRRRDPATFALTWRTPAFVHTMIGFGFASMLTLNMGFWTAPLALRSLPVDKATVGMVLGITAAVCGMAGVFLGGRLSDLMLRRFPAGRTYVGLASAVIPVPFVIGMCMTGSPWLFFLLNVPVVFVGIMWMAAGAATIQELVQPRMRGTASVTYFLVSTLLGAALGPYLVGKVSSATGSLATGVMAGLLAVPIACLSLWLAGRRVQAAEATKDERALAAMKGAGRG
ncbi:MFS transporter [Sphingomonas histidinilytica]|uniref:Major Facilitator Superfamily protein n=1 Tax=Rhizorhabdus histidinilytica TaxID=439228 RepID=A0A1T5FP49_9SPHN|nr:MFS transporter [Rhizorhabdus histidinilytica]MBO9377113.1 MFS transporter [Rhizorhabdus histidinilytica]SKB97918.1 Major Facilitator Superfamily protein [Rhizorhabdus histidinilytica]